MLSHLSKNLLKQGKPTRNIFSIREEENDVAVFLSFCLFVQLRKMIMLQQEEEEEDEDVKLPFLCLRAARYN